MLCFGTSHWARNWRPLPRLHTLSSRRTVWAKPPSMRRGGGCFFVGGWRFEVTWGFRRETWNTGWIRCRGGGRFNRIAVGVMIRVMGNGPISWGANFGLVVHRGMSCAESKTFCLTVKCGAGRRWRSVNLFIVETFLSRMQRAFFHIPCALWTRIWAAGTPTSLFSSAKIGGWYPRQQVNGDMSVKETGKLLYDYFTHGKEATQEFGDPSTRQRRDFSSSWLSLSVWLLVCGWKRDDSCGFPPTRVQNAFQKALMNCGPLSNVTSRGSPWRRKTCWTRIWAVSLEEGNFVSGTKCADLEKRSTMVSITECPWDSVKPVTKSIAICDQGQWGTGNGRRSPWGRWEFPLAWAQTGHAETHSSTSRRTDDHQKRWLSRASVQRTPGWQAREEEWAYSRTADWASLSTYIRLAGVLGGMTLPSRDLSTLSTISSWVAATIVLSGRMVSEISEFGGEGWRRNRASGLTFLDPGR